MQPTIPLVVPPVGVRVRPGQNAGNRTVLILRFPRTIDARTRYGAEMQHRHSFHTSRSSLGSFLRVAGALAPLLIRELVKDRETAWRWVPITSAVTAILAGISWGERVAAGRHKTSGLSVTER